MHVFEIQKYEKNVEKLWKGKLFDMELLRLGNFWRLRKYKSLLGLLIKVIVKNPLHSFCIIKKVIKSF